MKMNSSGVNCTLIAEGQSCLKIVLNLCGTLYLFFNWLGGGEDLFHFQLDSHLSCTQRRVIYTDILH